MRLSKSPLSRGLRRDTKRRPVAQPTPVPVEPREPDDEHAPPQAPEAGFRISSYELKRGLEVVELPTSLPAEVLDRLFKSR